jgi:hypothetical protein
MCVLCVVCVCVCVCVCVQLLVLFKKVILMPTKTCTKLSTVALFVRAKKWKQPKYLSTVEQVTTPCNGLIYSNEQ